jgi:protein-S-isoprenylcysteine O-methyltransferase Ste14
VTAASGETANVAVRPPLLYLAAILAGLALDALTPLRLHWPSLLVPAGMALVAAALLLFALALREFRRAGTSVKPYEPTTALIRSGPFRVSRNPIYLSLSFFQLGIGLWTLNGWVVALLVPVLAVMIPGVIMREERYLERRFGDEYRRYKASVGRWM